MYSCVLRCRSGNICYHTFIVTTAIYLLMSHCAHSRAANPSRPAPNKAGATVATGARPDDAWLAALLASLLAAELTLLALDSAELRALLTAALPLLTILLVPLDPSMAELTRLATLEVMELRSLLREDARDEMLDSRFDETDEATEAAELPAEDMLDISEEAELSWARRGVARARMMGRVSCMIDSIWYLFCFGLLEVLDKGDAQRGGLKERADLAFMAGGPEQSQPSQFP